MLAVIAVRPSVEDSVLHRGHIVGHQVAADLIAFVDGSPECTALRLPGKAIGVAQARGKDVRTACCWINFPDGGAVDLVFHTVFAGIAIGADRDIQTRTIAAGDYIFGPVMVDRTCGQIKHFYTGLIDLSFAGVIGKAHKFIGIGNIKIVADERHAKGRIQPLQEDCSRFHNAVTICVAQQGDAISARYARPPRVS